MSVYPVGGEGRGVPGVVGDWGGLGRAIPVPHQTSSQDPIFSHIPGLSPTHGQMKAILMYLMRFPR